MAKTFLFQGDSITDAGRDRNNVNYRGNGYPTLVAGRLGADHPGEFTFINKGISGNRVVDLYQRIREDFINLKPDYLTVLIGVNDVWHEIGGRRNGVDNKKYHKVYRELIEEVKAMCPGIKIFILEPFVLKAAATENDWFVFESEVAMRAASAKAVAEETGSTFIPLQEKFNALCEKAEPSYWLLDGVHPSAMGHEIIARAVAEAVEKTL